MNGRLYDPVIGRFFSPDKYVANSSFTQDFNRYTYARNNPLMYTDPDGDFLTWNINKNGFSIGFNLTPIGIPVGAGINIGWKDGGSIGFYGEIGYRLGGTGLGAGITVSQSIDYGFGSQSWTTTSNAGAYGSFGPINAGANVSYTYDIANQQGNWDWGINVGVNLFGTDVVGMGMNIGYGSRGWTLGFGGYYNPLVDYWSPVYEPEKWNDNGEIQLKNNCYSYMLDDPYHTLETTKPQPGDYSNGRTNTYTFDEILRLAQQDGMVKVPTAWHRFLYKMGYRKGYYVYLAIDENSDYHWYRQDKGGLWSHKRGHDQVINYDASNNRIIDPAAANRNYYFEPGYNYSKGILLWRRR